MTDNLPTTEIADREDLFVDNLCAGLNIKDAALKAGYSESYATKSIGQRLKNDPKLQEKIRKAFIAGNYAQVPKVLLAYNTAMDRILQDPAELSKLKHVPKQILQIAGILSPDAQPGHTTINVKEVRNLMLQVHESPGKMVGNADNDSKTLPPEPGSVHDAEYEES